MLLETENIQEIIPILLVVVAGERRFPVHADRIERRQGWRSADEPIRQIAGLLVDIPLQAVATAFHRRETGSGAQAGRTPAGESTCRPASGRDALATGLVSARLLPEGRVPEPAQAGFVSTAPVFNPGTQSGDEIRDPSRTRPNLPIIHKRGLRPTLPARLSPQQKRLAAARSAAGSVTGKRTGGEQATQARKQASRFLHAHYPGIAAFHPRSEVVTLPPAHPSLAASGRKQTTVRRGRNCLSLLVRAPPAGRRPPRQDRRLHPARPAPAALPPHPPPATAAPPRAARCRSGLRSPAPPSRRAG
jgi:hypothetical protein